MKKTFFPVITEFDMQLPYYFAGVGCFYEQEDIDRPQGHPDYQWIQCRSGRGQLSLNGTKHIIEKNRGMLLFPNEPHEYHALDSAWEVDWIIFRGKHIETFIRTILGLKHSEVRYITSPQILSNEILELYKAAASANHTKNLICSSLIYTVLTDIMRLTSSTQNASILDNFNRITPVLNYIDEHYAKQLSLHLLAGVAGLTPQYLCSTFKKYTSQTLFEYINMVRIHRSKELLLYDKKMQIKEVAPKVGFNDVSYFCSMFKKIEQMSPSQFKSLHS